MEDEDFVLRKTTTLLPEDLMDIEISFPKSHFVPVKIGELRTSSDLEKYIDFLSIKSNKYILYSKAIVHTSEHKSKEKNEVILLMAVDYFYVMNLETSHIGGQLQGSHDTFSYLEINKAEESKEDSKIHLEFHRTSKGEKDPPFTVDIQLLDDEDNDKLFKFLFIIKRQTAQWWQRYFEEKMEIRGTEIYQHHTFAYKVTSGNKFEPRFLVISNIFVYNVKMKSEKSRLNRRVFSYNERLWYHPIEGLVKLVVEPANKKARAPYLLVMHFDLDLQNKILVNLKRKKQKKTERIFGFVDVDDCRVALYQLMRIYDDITNGKELQIQSKFME